MAFISAAPLARPHRSALAAATSASRSAFLAPSARPRRATIKRAAAPAPRMDFEISEGVDFELNPIVVALAFFGWVVPSSIPTSIPLTNGSGLSQAFFASVQDNLARWPKGPALDDPFWLLLLLWHVGMFATLIFGTIGYNLSKNRSAP